MLVTTRTTYQRGSCPAAHGLLGRLKSGHSAGCNAMLRTHAGTTACGASARKTFVALVSRVLFRHHIRL